MRASTLALLLALLAVAGVAAVRAATSDRWPSFPGGGSFLPEPDLWRSSQP